MKKLSAALAALLVIFILLYGFGPGWALLYAPSLRPVEMTGTADDYVSHRESAFAGIKEGNRSTLIWKTTPGQKSLYSIVYLHGFSASPREISPVVEDVAQLFSANAYLPRLAAHGLKDGLMNELNDDDLFQDAEEAWQVGQKIGEKVIVVGTSTGATLALWLAARHPDMAAMVLLSPNLGIKDPRGFLAAGPVGYWIARLVVGPYYSWKPHNPVQEGFWTTRYSVNGVRVMTDVVNVVNALPFEKIAVPALVMWSPKDGVLNLPHALGTLKRLPSAKNVFVESPSADHVLAGDITSPATTQSTVVTIQNFLKTTLNLN